MRKRSVPVLRPMSPFSVSRIWEQGVQLASAHEAAQIRVLAPDLFHIRIALGRRFSSRPSWAVSKSDWGTVTTRVQAGRQRVTLETEAAKLTLRLSDGFWELRDHSGNEVFSCLPAGTGFTGEESKVTMRLGPEEMLFGLGETTGTFNKRGLR